MFVAGRPPVGFVQLDEVDGLAHVQALAVLPSHMRQGLGSALLDAAFDWARDHGYPAITLCTYARDRRGTAPFYASRGFVELTELTPELAELRDWERDVGLDEVGRRCVMRRDLTTRPPTRRTAPSSVVAAAAVMPARLMPSCGERLPRLVPVAEHAGHGGVARCGIVVTEMNTPTSAADLARQRQHAGGAGDAGR